jgi:hypothetical protein
LPRADNLASGGGVAVVMPTRRTRAHSALANDKQSPNKIRAKIKSAFGGLHVREAASEHLEQTITTLTGIAVARMHPSAAPNAFAPANRVTCEAELALILSAADTMKRAIEELHEPTISALANVGVLRSDLHRWAIELREAVERADVSDVPATLRRGRHRDDFAKRIAAYLASEFQFLTGCRPTMRVRTDAHAQSGTAYGPFLEFVTNVFRAMGIKAAPESFARAAVNTLKRRDRKKFDAAFKISNAEGMEYVMGWWNGLSAQQRAELPPQIADSIARWRTATGLSNGENMRSTEGQ